MNLTPEKVDVAIPYSMLRVSLHPLTLVFTGSQQPLEQSFKRAYYSNSIEHVRHCMLYAILFFSMFGILDAYVFPEQKFQLWFIRYVLVCPVFLLGLIFSYSDAYRRLWQFVNGFYIVVTGFAYVAMVVITPAPESFFYGVGIIFCVFFGYTFIHARFVTATIAGLLVIGGYQAAMLWLMDATDVIQLIFGAHLWGSIFWEC